MTERSKPHDASNVAGERPKIRRGPGFAAGEFPAMRFRWRTCDLVAAP